MDLGIIMNLVTDPTKGIITLVLLPFALPLVTSLFVAFFSILNKVILTVDDLFIDALEKIPVIGSVLKNAIQKPYIASLKSFNKDLIKTIEKVKD